MPSPLPEEGGFLEDDMPRVESDISGVSKDIEGTSSKTGALDSDADLGPRKDSKKRGRPSNQNKKKRLSSTPLQSSPAVTQNSSERLTPTIVRIGNLDDGHHADHDSGENDEEDDESNFPELSEIVSSKKRGRKSLEADQAGELEIGPQKKRGRPAKGTKAAIVDSDDHDLHAASKTRGRPRKSDSAGTAGSDAQGSAVTESPTKKTAKSVSYSDEGATRRSSRAAAESAKANISEQQTKKQQSSAVKATTSSAKGSKKASEQPAGRGRGRPKKKVIFSVEKLVDKSVDKKGAAKYLVKWEDYDASENTWEPIENLQGCMHLVEAYDEKEARSSKKTKKTKKA